MKYLAICAGRFIACVPELGGGNYLLSQIAADFFTSSLSLARLTLHSLTCRKYACDRILPIFIFLYH